MREGVVVVGERRGGEGGGVVVVMDWEWRRMDVTRELSIVGGEESSMGTFSAGVARWRLRKREGERELRLKGIP